MAVTVQQFRAIFPSCPNPEVMAPAVSEAWAEFGVTSLSARAGHLAIMANETGGFTSIGRENMRYSFDRAMELFPKVRRNQAAARDRLATVGMDKGRRFASWLYADLYGNGNEASEDGWNYRGGGITQLTFKSTYYLAGKALGVDLVGNPDSIVEPTVSARASAWFIVKYKPGILPLLDAGTEEDFLRGARLVGWTDAAGTQRRLQYRRRALKVLKPKSVAASKTAAGLMTAAGSTTVVAPNAEDWAQPLADMAREVLPQGMAAAATPGVMKWILLALAVAPLLFVGGRYVLKSVRKEIIHT